MEVNLSIQSSPKGRRSFFAVGDQPFVIGRQPGSDLYLPVAAVSRRHCRIQRTADGGLVIEDLKSANQTFVNGQPIRMAPLRAGDSIRVGNIELIVSIGGRPFGAGELFRFGPFPGDDASMDATVVIRPDSSSS